MFRSIEFIEIILREVFVEINDIIECCEQHNTEIKYYYKLFDVDINEAIERDSKRVHTVGEEVIEKQFNMLNQLKKNYKITT